jgi:amino acid transporter
LILAAVQVHNPEYKIQQWQIFALTCLLLLGNGAVASLPTQFLTRLTALGAIINGVSLAAFFIVIPTASINTPKFGSTTEVLWSFKNATDWPIGMAVLISFLSVIWTLTGYDAPYHLTEECSNSAVSPPRAIVITSGLGAILGWFLILLIGYTITDINGIIDSGQPMANYLFQVLGKTGGLGILSVVIVCLYFCGQAGLVVSSRLIFAYARDGALPGSSIWSRVSPRTQTPIFAGTCSNSNALTISLAELWDRGCLKPIGFRRLS